MTTVEEKLEKFENFKRKILCMSVKELKVLKNEMESKIISGKTNYVLFLSTINFEILSKELSCNRTEYHSLNYNN